MRSLGGSSHAKARRREGRGLVDEIIEVVSQLILAPKIISNSRSVIHSGLLVLLIDRLVLHYAHKKRKIASVWI